MVNISYVLLDTYVEFDFMGNVMKRILLELQQGTLLDKMKVTLS